MYAYACEPGAGSENGAGWIWSLMMARLAETWVITRTNNQPAIDNALAAVPREHRPHFVYVDLPQWSRFWKRGNRGARPYYVLWQTAALKRALQIDRQQSIDLVWHLTMSTVWLGSLAPLLDKPFGFGPAGGGVGTPWKLAPTLGVRGCIFEGTRAIAQWTGRYLNPMARLAWRSADIILTQNPNTRSWFPTNHQYKAVVFPHIVLDRNSADTATTRAVGSDSSKLTLLFAGRLIPWKGVALALHMLSRNPGWRLLICGVGPDEARLRKLAHQLGVNTQAVFKGWQDRDRLMKLMEDEADVFVFPSLHDEGGWVVVEALAAGLPVVCLDHGGPPVLGGTGVQIGTVGATVQRLEQAVRDVVKTPTPHRIPTFDSSVPALAKILRSVGWNIATPLT